MLSLFEKQLVALKPLQVTAKRLIGQHLATLVDFCSYFDRFCGRCFRVTLARTVTETRQLIRTQLIDRWLWFISSKAWETLHTLAFKYTKAQLQLHTTHCNALAYLRNIQMHDYNYPQLITSQVIGRSLWFVVTTKSF